MVYEGCLRRVSLGGGVVRVVLNWAVVGGTIAAAAIAEFVFLELSQGHGGQVTNLR